MVRIEIDGGALDIQVQGVHKLWALKSSLHVPLADVRDVRHDPDRARKALPGLRDAGCGMRDANATGTAPRP